MHRVNSTASGTLSTPAKIPSNCRWQRKRKAQVLKRPPCVGNDIRHGPIEEDLPVTFKLSTPLPLVNRRRRQSHLWLQFGFKWGTWVCSLLRDMAQMFHRQVSYITQQSWEACTAPVQQEDKDLHPGGIRLVHRLSSGHVGWCSSHFTRKKGKSQIHDTGCKLCLSWWR